PAPAPPRGSALHRPVPRQPQTDPVAALLAASKTQAERPLRLAFADRPPNPVRQWPREMVTGQAARPEATLTPRPIFTARHAQDALFERWDDKILGVPAWNFLR